jgi:FdhD protein
MKLQPSLPIKYRQFNAGQWHTVQTYTISEAPVSLTVNGQVWLTFMCTPIQLEALAVGFLFNEGIIKNKSELASVRVCPAGDNVDVWLEHPTEQPRHWKRTSGCTGGVTSISPLEEIPPIFYEARLHANEISNLLKQFQESQILYKEAGGVHTSALSNGNSLVATSDDIGRHNTLDKLAGQLLLEEIHLDNRILLTTGRISSEMLQKALKIGAPILISRTSPSSLAVLLAQQYNLTLIGYAQRHSFNLYTHPQRIFN